MVSIILNLDVDKILKSYAIFKYSSKREESTPELFEKVLPQETRVEEISFINIDTQSVSNNLNFSDISTSGC